MKLIIAEKPSVANGISPVVGAKTRKQGYIEGNGYIVSWCYGHLVGLKDPDEYGEKWGKPWRFEQFPMIPDNWEMKVKEQEQFKILKELMERSDIDEIICATDADREGECIFRYVYYLARCKKPVMRLWISSLEESAVKSALSSMKSMSDYDDLYAAGFSRAKADWLVGMNGTRLFSVRYGGKTIHVGRVQTPTLAMIVKRDNDVKNFVKQKYFTVELDCGGLMLSSERIDDEAHADSLAEKCNNASAKISGVKREIKTVNPPKLYDLTTLQREANKTYGYTAEQTLEYLQSLYEAKLATYPRTDSQYLSEDMRQTALEMVDIVGKVYGYSMEHTPDISKCINNEKVTGHHAIIPTKNISDADLDKLPETQRNILLLISNKLFCAAAPAHKYESVKISAECAGNTFTASGKTIKEIGWKKYAKTEDKGKKDEEKTLPEVSEGQIFDNVKAKKAEHFTSPPKPYTEDTLLSAMEHAGVENYVEDSEIEYEKKGLGTPATRAAIIEGIVKNGYAERKGKQIVSTETGRNVIEVVPDEVKSPKLTSEWEMSLQQIQNGQSSADDFMRSIENYVREICDKNAEKVENSAFRTSNVKGKCPNCGGDVLFGKFGFYCSKKCGLQPTYLFGTKLTDKQIQTLLDGKSITFTSKNGSKTKALPETVKNEYNGKITYQWKTEKVSK